MIEYYETFPPRRHAFRSAARRRRERWRSAINSWSSSGGWTEPVCLAGTGSYRSRCAASGWGRGPPWPSCRPPRCWPRTTKAAGSSGAESQAQPGRAPKTRRRLRDLIRRMAREIRPAAAGDSSGTRLARLCGRRADRRHVHAPDVAAPSPKWRAFLATHAREIVAVDFFLVRT